MKKEYMETTMKSSHLGRHDVLAFSLILAASIMRGIFIFLGWPWTNSDEGTIGIMALRIAYHGDLPIFYYGQHYMGSHQAFLGALFFHLFGPSLFALRLGLVVLFALFLASSYILARLLYTRGWALFSLLLLCLGSGYVMARELSAIGGYTETLLFGSLLFVLSALLVLTYRPRSFRWWRVALYLLWGLVAGCALWSDLLIAPFVCMSGVVLFVVCWREFLHGWPVLLLLLGLGMGAFPLLYYNLHALPGQDSWSVLNSMRGSQLSWSQKITGLLNTIRISIPLMTGEPFCPLYGKFVYLAPVVQYTRRCQVLMDLWGFGYCAVFLIALCLACWTLWRTWRQGRQAPGEEQAQLQWRRAILHAGLLGAALLTIYMYAFSNGSLHDPDVHARYVIGLLVCLPALFWWLWQGITAQIEKKRWPALVGKGGCALILTYVLVMSLIGPFLTAFGEVPQAIEIARRNERIVNTLVQLGVKSIYTDYWGCNKFSFLSQERIACVGVSDELKPGRNRVPGYLELVQHDPKAAYLFSASSKYVPGTDISPANSVVHKNIERYFQQTGRKYKRISLEGYWLYLPQ